MIFNGLTVRGPRRLLGSFVLIGIALAATACSSGAKSNTSIFVPVGTASPPSTAQDVLARAILNAGSAASVRSEGAFFSYGPAQGMEREDALGLQAVRFTTEWTAPDRTRYTTISPDGDRSQTITIGETSYTRRVDGFEPWREFPANGRAAENPALSLVRNVEVDEEFEVIDYRGAQTYRLTGRPIDESLVFVNPNGKSLLQSTVFVDVASNNVVRFEQVIATCFTDVDCVETPSTELRMAPSELPNFLEQWFDFTFLETPFDIEAPVSS